MANLKYGSSGDDVKKLQEALVGAGYDVGKTGADGVLGKNTEAAIKQYQKDNGLTVDGIAGKNTLGSLYNKTTTGTGGNAGANANNNPAPKTNPVEPAAPAEPDTSTGGGYTQPEFTKSENFYTAQGILDQHRANSIGAYAPVWEDEANDWLSKYQNRDPFSYNMNEDALYQQYKDQYIQLGQLASEDVMGQAAAMTGGYANSYAQSVSQQAYNQYLNQLNDVALELHDRAYNIYNQEGQDMLNMYNLYMDREQYEYSKYQTELENWYREDSRLQGIVDDYYNQEWNEYTNSTTDSWNQYVHEDNKATTAQTTKYNNLASIIATTGRIPSAEELEAAGMTEWEAKSIAEGYKNDKAEADSVRAETAKSNNYNKLVNLIASGYTPTAQQLKDAGIDEQEYNILANEYKSKLEAASKFAFKSDSDRKYYNNKVEEARKAGSPSDIVAKIEKIGAELGRDGYTDAQVADYIYSIYEELISEGIISPEDVGIQISSGVSSSGVAGGGGGGVSYWEIK